MEKLLTNSIGCGKIVARKEGAYEENNQRFHFGRCPRKGKARCREERRDGQRVDFNVNRKTKVKEKKMIKAIGKPNEIMEFIDKLIEEYGNITLGELCIILEKEKAENESYREQML